MLRFFKTEIAALHVSQQLALQPFVSAPILSYSLEAQALPPLPPVSVCTLKASLCASRLENLARRLAGALEHDQTACKLPEEFDSPGNSFYSAVALQAAIHVEPKCV